MTNEEWGPWIEHDGKGCPCVGQYVHVIYEDGFYQFGVAGSRGGQAWLVGLEEFCIIRYRIRKPRAIKLLQSIVENPPKQLIKEDA